MLHHLPFHGDIIAHTPSLTFLKTLDGIGTQKAKQIIASLQGKVGRFALLKSESEAKVPVKKEIIEEKLVFKVFSGYPSDKELKSVNGDKINNYNIMLNCLEAGDKAYNEIRVVPFGCHRDRK